MDEIVKINGLVSKDKIKAGNYIVVPYVAK
jgi:hypothetical protein